MRRVKMRTSPIGWRLTWLRRAGAPWIAPDSILPGEKWVEAIGRGLDGSGVFVVALTPAAVASNWVRNETNNAIELEVGGEVRFIPLEVEACTVPTLWNSYQRVSFRGRYEDGLAALLRRLEMGDGAAGDGETRRQGDKETKPEVVGQKPPASEPPASRSPLGASPFRPAGAGADGEPAGRLRREQPAPDGAFPTGRATESDRRRRQLVRRRLRPDRLGRADRTDRGADRQSARL